MTRGDDIHANKTASRTVRRRQLKADDDTLEWLKDSRINDLTGHNDIQPPSDFDSRLSLDQLITKIKVSA